MCFLNKIKIVIFCIAISYSNCLMDGLYCGKKNCYDILQISTDSSKHEIAKAYRNLARKYHPDLHRSESTKKEAEENFKLIATAYEILKDEEIRADYDYMLNNPQEYYANYYRYYRRRVAPKVDIRIVLIVTISVISVIQYYCGWQRYELAIKYFSSIPKYRNKAMEMAEVEIRHKVNKKTKNRNQKSVKQQELEVIIRRIIEDKMEIKGAYAKPSIADTLWVQLIIFPFIAVKYFWWYGNWMWRHDILNKPYGEDEKLYIIRRNLQMGKNEFDALDHEKKMEFLSLELWKKENFIAWKKNQENDAKKILAGNAKYKQYRRYMKNRASSRLTYEE